MTVAAERIEAAIRGAPGWCRAGITAPDSRLRQDAIATLAVIVAERIDQPVVLRDPNQMALPL